MNQVKPTILFDLDGTVLDSAPEFLHCLNYMLAQRKLPLITLQSLRAKVSLGGKAMICQAFKLDPSDPKLPELLQEFLASYSAFIGQHCDLFDGIPELFNFLESNAFDWGVVTNKPRRFAFTCLDQFNLTQRAKVIVCADDVSEAKPSAVPLLHACHQLGIDTNQCWYVGDSIVDVKASKSAKIPVAIAEYGYFDPCENHLSWQADMYFQHPKDLISHFSKMYLSI